MTNCDSFCHPSAKSIGRPELPFFPQPECSALTTTRSMGHPMCFNVELVLALVAIQNNLVLTHYCYLGLNTKNTL